MIDYALFDSVGCDGCINRRYVDYGEDNIDTAAWCDSHCTYCKKADCRIREFDEACN